MNSYFLVIIALIIVLIINVYFDSLQPPNIDEVPISLILGIAILSTILISLYISESSSLRNIMGIFIALAINFSVAYMFANNNLKRRQRSE